MMGQGSVNHNSRAFNAKNTDRSRSHLNITYCHENIKTVFHELFDEALKRYNDKQTRADRKIEDYYEKIRSSKQEKPFHEIILQVGNKDDMSAEGEDGQLAAAVLDEYMRGFQERGANGVIGVDFDYEVLGETNGMMMVAVSGTAVKLG
jgi:flagellar hook-basal body complex protein FliE